MSTKDETNTTVETLEYARCVLEFVEGDQKGPAESVIELIEAAIPRAELEGQAVELLENTPVTQEETAGWIDKKDALLTQIENLDG